MVTSYDAASEQVEVAGTGDGSASRLHVELGEDVLGVGAKRVDGNEQTTGNFRPGQIGCQEANDLELSVAELLNPERHQRGNQRGVPFCEQRPRQFSGRALAFI